MSKKRMEKGFREGVDRQADLFVLRKKREKEKGRQRLKKKKQNKK